MSAPPALAVHPNSPICAILIVHRDGYLTQYQLKFIQVFTGATSTNMLYESKFELTHFGPNTKIRYTPDGLWIVLVGEFGTFSLCSASGMMVYLNVNLVDNTVLSGPFCKLFTTRTAATTAICSSGRYLLLGGGESESKTELVLLDCPRFAHFRSMLDRRFLALDKTEFSSSWEIGPPEDLHFIQKSSGFAAQLRDLILLQVYRPEDASRCHQIDKLLSQLDVEIDLASAVDVLLNFWLLHLHKPCENNDIIPTLIRCISNAPDGSCRDRLINAIINIFNGFISKAATEDFELNLLNSALMTFDFEPLLWEISQWTSREETLFEFARTVNCGHLVSLFAEPGPEFSLYSKIWQCNDEVSQALQSETFSNPVVALNIMLERHIMQKETNLNWLLAALTICGFPATFIVERVPIPASPDNIFDTFMKKNAVNLDETTAGSFILNAARLLAYHCLRSPTVRWSPKLQSSRFFQVNRDASLICDPFEIPAGSPSVREFDRKRCFRHGLRPVKKSTSLCLMLYLKIGAHEEAARLASELGCWQTSLLIGFIFKRETFQSDLLAKGMELVSQNDFARLKELIRAAHVMDEPLFELIVEEVCGEKLSRVLEKLNLNPKFYSSNRVTLNAVVELFEASQEMAERLLDVAMLRKHHLEMLLEQCPQLKRLMKLLCSIEAMLAWMKEEEAEDWLAATAACSTLLKLTDSAEFLADSVVQLLAKSTEYGAAAECAALTARHLIDRADFRSLLKQWQRCKRREDESMSIAVHFHDLCLTHSNEDRASLDELYKEKLACLLKTDDSPISPYLHTCRRAKTLDPLLQAPARNKGPEHWWKPTEADATSQSYQAIQYLSEKWITEDVKLSTNFLTFLAVKCHSPKPPEQSLSLTRQQRLRRSAIRHLNK